MQDRQGRTSLCKKAKTGNVTFRRGVRTRTALQGQTRGGAALPNKKASSRALLTRIKHKRFGIGTKGRARNKLRECTVDPQSSGTIEVFGNEGTRATSKSKTPRFIQLRRYGGKIVHPNPKTIFWVDQVVSDVRSPNGENGRL